MNFLDIYLMHLLEKKDHIIDRLNLTDEEKIYAKDFFTKHSNYESKIDWNRKDLSIKDFQQIYDEANKSVSQKKRNIKLGDLTQQFEGTKVKIWYSDNNIIFASPTCYEDAKFMDSFQCYGIGAKWCIGYEGGDSYWNSYVYTERKAFIFIYIKDIQKKWMIEIVTNANNFEQLSCDLWSAEDEDVLEDKRFLDIIKYLKIENLPNELYNLDQKVAEFFIKLSDPFFECNSIEDVLNKSRELQKKSNLTSDFVSAAGEKLSYLGNKSFTNDIIKPLLNSENLIDISLGIKFSLNRYGHNEDLENICYILLVNNIKQYKEGSIKNRYELLEILKQYPDLSYKFLKTDYIKNFEKLENIPSDSYNIIVKTFKPEILNMNYSFKIKNILYDDKIILIFKQDINTLEKIDNDSLSNVLSSLKEENIEDSIFIYCYATDTYMAIVNITGSLDLVIDDNWYNAITPLQIINRINYEWYKNANFYGEEIKESTDEGFYDYLKLNHKFENCISNV